ncbi:MAG: phosphodiester glycosidase family protein [Verrucomicrobia bacterium]|nr:phosphodiester glycosidase family protein [Verrucomicrobiota bacterium]
MLRIAVTLILLFPCSLAASWKIVQRTNLIDLKSELAGSILKVTDGSIAAEIQVVFFPADRFHFNVILNRDREFFTAKQVALQKDAIAAINGGYFNSDGSPIGLLISEGRLISPLQRSRLLSGVFLLKNYRPELRRVQELLTIQGVQEAIQCGPFLVDNKHTVAGLNASRIADRSFIFDCGASLWGFGICRSLSLAAMGSCLNELPIVPGRNIVRALNLDGGTSTSFFARIAEEQFDSPGLKAVSDFLVLRAR